MIQCNYRMKEGGKILEQWRQDFKRKLETKAFIEVDLSVHLYNIYCDDNVDEDTIPLKTVLEEIIWHWIGRLNEGGHVDSSLSNYKKRQYKKVADNFLKKYYDEDIVTSDLYQRGIEWVDGEPKLRG